MGDLSGVCVFHHKWLSMLSVTQERTLSFLPASFHKERRKFGDIFQLARLMALVVWASSSKTRARIAENP